MLREWLYAKLSMCLALTVLSVSVLADDTPLRFGVLVVRPKEQVAAEWQSFAAYLENKIGRQVQLTVYTYPELDAAVMRKEVDVVLTNPGHYILLRYRDKLSAPLATQISIEGQHELSNFGGVIFTLNDNPRISTLEDLEGKRIAAVGNNSLGGYQMQAFELFQAGMSLPDQENMLFTGMPHDHIVSAVLEGRAEAGFVRSGILEAMAHEEKLDLALIKLIHPVNDPDFPYKVSTSLYPEWPVAIMPQIDENLAKQLAIALLSLPADSQVARALKIYGFTVPADYRGVENILRQLRMPPFDSAPVFTLADLWRKYKHWILFFGVLGLLLTGMTVALVRQNRRIRHIMRYNRNLFEASLDPLVTISKDGNIMDVNTAAMLAIGLPREELKGSEFSDYFTDPEGARACYQKVFSYGSANDYPLTIRHRDGHLIDLLYNASVYHNENGQVEGVLAAARDITERKHFEDTLRDHEERLSLATIYNGVGIWDWNLKTQEMVWDDSMYALYHIRREDFSGTEEAWRKCLHPADLEREDDEIEAALSGKRTYDTEFRVCWPTGEIRYIKAVAKVFRDETGKPVRMLGTNIDITDRKLLQIELERQAHIDCLTGISNRRHFMALAELELTRSVRYGTPLSIFMMDIDCFKKINDSHGHKIGDTVLKKLAAVCQETLREVDIVGRIGGEEFAILLPETKQTEAVEAAERLRASMAKAKVPLEDGLPLHFTVSIGVASWVSRDDNIDVLLNLADKALYQAKEAGRNRVCVDTSNTERRLLCLSA